MSEKAHNTAAAALARFKIPPEFVQRAGILHISDADARNGWGFKYGAGDDLVG